MNQLGPKCAGRHADGVSQGPSHSGRGAGLLLSPQPQGSDLEVGEQPDHCSCFKKPEAGQKPGSETPRTSRLVLTWRINYTLHGRAPPVLQKRVSTHPPTTATPQPGPVRLHRSETLELDKVDVKPFVDQGSAPERQSDCPRP